MTSGGAVNFDYLFKYIIIGDAAVGKSNLLLRYAHGQFKPEYQLQALIKKHLILKLILQMEKKKQK